MCLFWVTQINHYFFLDMIEQEQFQWSKHTFYLSPKSFLFQSFLKFSIKAYCWIIRGKTRQNQRHVALHNMIN